MSHFDDKIRKAIENDERLSAYFGQIWEELTNRDWKHIAKIVNKGISESVLSNSEYISVMGFDVEKEVKIQDELAYHGFYPWVSYKTIERFWKMELYRISQRKKKQFLVFLKIPPEDFRSWLGEFTESPLANIKGDYNVYFREYYKHNP